MKLFLIGLSWKPSSWRARYVDLYHVQQITELHYKCEPERDVADRDGILSRVKSHGYASFSYQMAFSDTWYNIKLDYEATRYEHGDEGRFGKVDAVAHLEEFKAMYERFLAAREALDTRSVLYNPIAG